MQTEVVRLLTVAIAVSVPQDAVAYEMLQWEYIRSFERYYKERTLERRSRGEQNDPIILDEMINFAVQELPIRVPDCRSLTELYSESKKTEIAHRFLSENISKMLTRLAKRDTVKSSIRTNLHRADKQNNYAAIESTKFDQVFTDFMLMFERNCAASFRFEGEFLSYVMFSFIHYYYASHNRDIWKIFRDVDIAKRETESSIVEVKYLDTAHHSNLPIHDLITNIVAINDLMFSHSGQSDDARGVCYDIYYLILNHLCDCKVAEINTKLNSFSIRLIDELDRKQTRNGLSENKSIASKINNAKELVIYLFECIRKGGWSLDNIMELRDQCFTRGKRDRDGKNCIWKDVQDKAETSRYLDMRMTSHNYQAFDLLFKGVLSVYTLMKALEERGASLVGTYVILSRVFKDKQLSRNINTLEDLEYLDLMKELQNAPVDTSINHGDLQVFDDMVHTYAGSAQNNHENIRRNRQLAFLNGLLDNPRLKQKGTLQDSFSQLQSVAYYMTAIPRSYEEYIYRLVEFNTIPPCFAPLVMLNTDDISGCVFSNAYSNKFLLNKPDLVNYYLYRVAMNEVVPQTWEWHLGTALMPCVIFRQRVNISGTQGIAETYGMYVPLVDKFLMCPMYELDPSITKLDSYDIYSLHHLVNSFTYNGQRNAELTVGFEGSPRFILTPLLKRSSWGKDGREEALQSSIGFDSFLGFGNLLQPDVQNRLQKIKVYSKYQSSVERYVEWMGNISLIQNSLVDLLQTMYSYGLYLALSSTGVDDAESEARGTELVYSLLRSEFTEDSLNWFFGVLLTVMQSKTLQKVDFTWKLAPATKIDFTHLDLSCLNLIFDESVPSYQKGTFMYDLVDSLKNYNTPGQRFVQLYNFLNVRLNFIRLLRDAYDLTFNVISRDLSTLSCEYNSQFEIMSTIEHARLSVGSGSMMDIKYATIDSISSEDMIRFVGDIRMSNWRNFSVLCEDLSKHFEKCSRDISSLVDYEITKSQQVQSSFSDIGSLFYAAGPYSDPFVLSILYNLKPRAKKDSAGFMIMKNSYFCGILGESTYYIHSTGRILEAVGNKYQPRLFDFSKEEDKELYSHIIDDAMRRNVW